VAPSSVRLAPLEKPRSTAAVRREHWSGQTDWSSRNDAVQPSDVLRSPEDRRMPQVIGDAMPRLHDQPASRQPHSCQVYPNIASSQREQTPASRARRAPTAHLAEIPRNPTTRAVAPSLGQIDQWSSWQLMDAGGIWLANAEYAMIHPPS
jgi:hypothetical protein